MARLRQWIGRLLGILLGGTALTLVLRITICTGDINIHLITKIEDNTYSISDNIITISGEDTLGRTAEFAIDLMMSQPDSVYTIHEELLWVLGRSDSLETALGQRGVVTEMLPYEIRNLKAFRDATGIIVVGTASEEVTEFGTVLEIERSRNRAEALAYSIRGALGNRSLYKLILGIHKIDPDLIDSSIQRRAIIIGIISHNNSMETSDLEHALRDAIDSQERFSFRTNDYSTFYLESSTIR